MSAQARTGPMPYTSVNVVPDARPRTAIPCACGGTPSAPCRGGAASSRARVPTRSVGLHRGRGLEGLRAGVGVRSIELLGNSPRREVRREGMEPTDDLVAQAPDVMVPLGQSRSTSAWSAGWTDRSPGERRAAMATERASFGSFLSERPCRARCPDASVAGTSRTSSPASTSCWASR